MKKRKIIRKYGVITFASMLFGAGLSLFIDPNNLAPGGVSGLSVIFSRLLPFDTGTIFLVLNIPILILGMVKFGGKFILSTLYCTIMVSAFTNLFMLASPLTAQPLLAAVFGGALVAAGIGGVLRTGASTGGTDIIVKCLKQKKPHLKTGTLFLLIDSVIILLGGVLFGNVDSVLYSALSAAVTSQILDLVLYGKDEAKMIYIISDASKAITDRILEELNTGVTHLEGSGAYRKAEKQVILCAIRKPYAWKVEEIVRQEDQKAFMIVTSATEIFGEGYKSYFGERI